MADRFSIEPPGWSSFDELVENLTHYLIENSPYSKLSGEKMPKDMLAEMKNTIKGMANAFYHDSKTVDSGFLWYILKNYANLATIGDDILKVNFIEGNGITIESTISNDTSDQEKVKKIVNIKFSTVGKISEVGRIENLQDKNIRVNFKSGFTEIPVGDEPRVYRTTNSIDPSKYRRENVMFYFTKPNWLDHTGFDLVIEEFESLNGIVIEYDFTQL